jgi:hypothetical protein
MWNEEDYEINENNEITENFCFTGCVTLRVIWRWGAIAGALE